MSADTVVAMRLVNGDEILGRLADDQNLSTAEFTLTRVRHVIVQQTADGLQTVLMPWSFCNVNGEVKVVRANVLAFLNPDATSVAAYQQQTTTIQLSL